MLLWHAECPSVIRVKQSLVVAFVFAQMARRARRTDAFTIATVSLLHELFEVLNNGSEML